MDRRRARRPLRPALLRRARLLGDLPVSGPLDESWHSYLRVSDSGVKVRTVKPHRELTHEERVRIRELQAIERWQERIYARRAARRRPPQQDQRKGSDADEQT